MSIRTPRPGLTIGSPDWPSVSVCGDRMRQREKSWRKVLLLILCFKKVTNPNPNP